MGICYGRNTMQEGLIITAVTAAAASLIASSIEEEFWYQLPLPQQMEDTIVNHKHSKALLYLQTPKKKWIVLIEEITNGPSKYTYKEVSRARRKTKNTFLGLVMRNRYNRIRECCIQLVKDVEEGVVLPSLVFMNIKEVLNLYHNNSSPELLLCKTSLMIHYLLGILLKEAILGNDVDRVSEILRYFDI